MDHKVRKWSELNRAYPYPSIEEPQEHEVYDCFYKKLEYTPYGMKAHMGTGPNRMNYVNVAKAMQGLCCYYQKKLKITLKSVVIAFDTSHYAKSLAMTAASVLTANGVQVYFVKDPSPTPLMNFAVRHYGSDLGIMFSGRHHMMSYCGFKINFPNVDILSEHEVRDLNVYMGMIDPVEGISHANFDEAVGKGGIKYLKQDVFEKYVAEVSTLAKSDESALGTLKIVYTPYHGTGHQLIEDLLRANGFTDIHSVSFENRPISSLNLDEMALLGPETVFNRAMEMGSSMDADLLLATDMTGTHFAVMVRDSVTYRQLQPHEISALLLDHFDHQYTSQKRKQVVKHLLSSELIERVADYKGLPVVASHVDEKDGITGCLLTAQLASFYKARGLTLIDVLERLNKRHGHYVTAVRMLELQGEDGFHRIEHIMGFFRFCNPTTLGEHVRKVDYRFGMEDYPAVNMVKLCWSDSIWVAVRPSMFEPKLEFHFSAWGENQKEADSRLESLLDKVKAILPEPVEHENGDFFKMFK